LITTPPATIIPPSTGAQASWLDREYMVVIVAVSAFAVFLLLSICVLCIVRLYHTNNIMRGMLRYASFVNKYNNDQDTRYGFKISEVK